MTQPPKIPDLSNLPPGFTYTDLSDPTQGIPTYTAPPETRSDSREFAAAAAAAVLILLFITGLAVLPAVVIAAWRALL